MFHATTVSKIQSDIVSAYKELADKYDELIDHKPHNAYYDRPNTLALMPDVQGKSILDAACGPGKYAEVLLLTGAIVTGFDISPKMVVLANKRNNGEGSFLYTTCRSLWICWKTIHLILYFVPLLCIIFLTGPRQ